MDDPRGRRRPDRTPSSSPIPGGAALPDTYPAHPWVGIVARFGSPDRSRRPADRVVVIRWPTSTGVQPVLFVVRRRPD